MAEIAESLIEYDENLNLESKVYLMKKICSMHLQERGNTNMHVTKVLSVVDQLDELGIVMTENLVAAFLLYSIPKKYNSVGLDLEFTPREINLNYVEGKPTEEYNTHVRNISKSSKKNSTSKTENKKFSEKRGKIIEYYFEKLNLKIKVYLLKKLCSTHLQENGNMEMHITNILSVVDQLKELGITMSNNLVAAFLFYSIPKKYNLLGEDLELRLEDTDLDLGYIEKKLLEKYNAHVRCIFKYDEEVVLKTENKKFSEDRKSKSCSYCRNSTHYTWDCRPLKKKIKKRKKNKENRDTLDIHDQRMARVSQDAFHPEKLRKAGVTILKGIKLDENLIKENNKILKKFLSSFIEEMKRRDKLFRSLYQKPHFTGSYYSDLRISQPDEFDINLVLNLPFKRNDCEFLYHPQVPSYAKYHLKDPVSAAVGKNPLLMRLFVDGYLEPEKVRKWIQSVVDKAMMFYRYQYPIMRIERSASGPARTLTLIKSKGVIDIDFVPVIPCILKTKQLGIDGQVSAMLGRTLKTFLVPKPYFPGKQTPVNDKEIAHLWRTHFPLAEEKLIHDKGCIKSVIKLLKLLRDKNNWKILASYYLKTVVMWMLLENYVKEGGKEDKIKNYWKEDKLVERFIEALEKLAKYVEKKNIPYFFNKKNNLLMKIGVDEACNISHRLYELIKDVKNDPKNFWKIFHVSPTFNI